MSRHSLGFLFGFDEFTIDYLFSNMQLFLASGVANWEEMTVRMSLKVVTFLIFSFKKSERNIITCTVVSSFFNELQIQGGVYSLKLYKLRHIMTFWTETAEKVAAWAGTCWLVHLVCKHSSCRFGILTFTKKHERR